MLHVAIFVVGSVAFVSIASVALCSIAKGLIGSPSALAAADEAGPGPVGAPGAPRGAAPYVRPGGARSNARRAGVTPP